MLLVEDDEVFGRAIVRTLAARMYDVVWLKSCLEARDVLRSSPSPQFQCALIDDRLPDGFGLDLFPLIELMEPKPVAGAPHRIDLP